MDPSTPAAPADDRHWYGSARLAVGCALVFCAMSLLVGWDAGSLTLLRALLWFALSAAVCVILLPPLVSAGPGWLEVRTLCHRRTIRTDALTAVWRYDSVSPRLVLRDAFGNGLDLAPRVLAANPGTS